MLYQPDLHEPLTGKQWDAERARGAIRALVADVDAAYSPDELWPAHEWDGWQAATPLKNLYVGAAGVVWALEELQLAGFESSLDLPAVARLVLERFRAEPDFQAGEDGPRRTSSLLCGETGVALVAFRLTQDDSLADDLLALVEANLGNEANDLMWGVPGTLLAARALHAWTGDPRFADAIATSEEAVRAERGENGLWTQHLWGVAFEGLSPIHGLVGNVAALGELGNAAEALRQRATVEDGRANWFGAEWKLQWCDGGAGIVAHAAHFLDEELLGQAAELVWEAGPAGPEKGAGICHGTAGNGYALLKTFERMGDERWLERARAFAVHALAQAARLPGRYSLFTGGPGVALFAADCLEARARYPVLDRL